MRRMLLRKMCNLTCKKALFLVAVTFFLVLFTSYMVLFNHGEPEEIMAANKHKRHQNPRNFMKHKSHDRDELDDQIDEEVDKAKKYWDNFISTNDFVSIGEIYDTCDEKERVMVGRTIMLPEMHWGGIKGVKSRTFVNLTLYDELEGGNFHLEVKYNGNSLFSRSWEFCTLDEDYDDRVIFCPFNPGEYSFVKDRSIPVILPKGRYQTKGWITDQSDDTVVCGLSDFTL